MKNTWSIPKALCFMWILIILGIIQNISVIPEIIKLIDRIMLIIVSIVMYWIIRNAIKNKLMDNH